MKLSPKEYVGFYHGIASGEPSSDDVVLWTRITPPFQDEYGVDREDIYNEKQLNKLKRAYESISVQWAISKKKHAIKKFDCSKKKKKCKCGETETSIDIDYTVKIIVDGLDDDEWYYYQFKVGDVYSAIGRTRTIPTSHCKIASWRFAFASCKKYPHGFFNNLGDIGQRTDLDMMVWLGDYIYELPDDEVVNGAEIGREPFPNHDLYNLSHYRQRYLQHKLDVDVQSAESRLPWFIMWDDHDVVNDYWRDGVPDEFQNDTLFGVNFAKRKMNAFQAFFEYLPVRPIDVDARAGLHRSYAFGKLFDLILVDSRSQRTEATETVEEGAALPVDEHYAFGERQLNWIINELKTSKRERRKWRILANPDVFGQSPPSEVFNGRVFFGSGKLEGYAAERQVLFDSIIKHNINNVINLAGGPHTGVVQKLYSTGTPIQDDPRSYPIATEFVTDGLSSKKTKEEERYLPYLDKYDEEWSWVSPYLRLLVDGYCIMDINEERVKVEYWVNDNLRSPDTKSVLDATFCVFDDIVEFDERCKKPSSKKKRKKKGKEKRKGRNQNKIYVAMSENSDNVPSEYSIIDDHNKPNVFVVLGLALFTLIFWCCIIVDIGKYFQ